MRDGMPVVALVVAVIALVVAFSGLMSRGTSVPADAPEEAIQKAENRLKAIQTQRQAMRKEMDEVAAQAARAMEFGSGGGARVDPAEIERSVGEAVGAALRARLAEEAKRVGAPAPRPTARDSFDIMLKDLAKSLPLEDAKSAALRSAFHRQRDELNKVFKKTPKGAERDRQARLVRSRTDASLRKVLSPVEFDKFAKWRKTTKNSYAKRFFGL